MQTSTFRCWLWALLSAVTCTGAFAQDCISGTVFEDVNGNGIQDTGESGLVGFAVTAIAPNGVVLNATTDISGNYQFCMLIPGGYYVFPQLPGPDFEANPPHHNLVYIPPGSLAGNNFGVVNLSELGAIVGHTYFDADGDGVQDPNEPDLEGVSVMLDGAAGPLATTTGADGRFRFDRLPAGDYTITIAAGAPALPNTSWNGPNIVALGLEAGQTSNDIRLGRVVNPGFGAVIGVICYDLNADGINDPASEPGIYGRVGVTVQNGQGQLAGSALVDASGRYVSAGLPQGNYIIRSVYDPEEFSPTTPVEYSIDLPPGFEPAGPFYFEPRRKIFRCGMAASTFGSIVSGSLVMAVKDIRDRSSLAAQPGTSSAWAPPFINQPNWNVSKMGEVFGIATDEDFNAYIAATKMPGYVGGSFNIIGSTPLIYWINPFTGLPTTLVTATSGGTLTGLSAIDSEIGGVYKGLGNICSNKNGWLFATNMSEENIIVLRDAGHPPALRGQVVQVYNPTGIVAGSMSGRHLWGIGYNEAENRIYYSTSPSIGTVQIHSVGFVAGQLDASTETFELAIPIYYPQTDVADIAFTQNGTQMLIAERNNPHGARVLQFSGGSGAWGGLLEVYVGGHGDGRNSAGGVDYCYDSFTGDTPPGPVCEPFIAASGNALNYQPSSGPNKIYGYAIFPTAGNGQPNGGYADDPADFLTINSTLIDNDVDVIQTDKGYMGDVEVFDCACPASDCATALGLEMLPSSPANSTPEECCVQLSFSNTGNQAIHAIDFAALDGVELANMVWAPGFSRPNWSATHATVVPSAGGAFPANVQNLFEFCAHNRLATPQYVVISYLNAQLDTICRDTLTLECPPERACLYILSDSLLCDSNGYKYMATIANPTGSDFPVGYVKFNVYSPFSATYTFTSADFGGLPLQPGQSAMVMFNINTSADYYGQDLCFILSAHDDEDERLCCAEIDTCIAFPLCDPCPFVDAVLEPNGQLATAGDSCCYTLLITNEFTDNPGFFTAVQVMMLDPQDEFSNVQTFPAPAGWSLPVEDPINQMYTWTHPGGAIPLVDNLPLFSFCVKPVYRTDSIYIKVNWFNQDSIVCSDTLALFCPACLEIVTDSLWCERGVPPAADVYHYAFQFINHSPFVVNAVGIVESGNQISPDLQFITPVSPGGQSDWIPIQLTGGPGEICFDIVLRQITDSVNITCCYATHCIELPPCETLSPFECPNPALADNDPCPQSWLPVCGCDDVAYANPCFALNAGVYEWTFGDCDSNVLINPNLVLTAEITPLARGVRLNWQMPLAMAGSFSYFVVLRLDPGVTRTLGYVTAIGVAAYTFVDPNPLSGNNAYQIVGVNNAGIPTYSNLASVQVLAQWNEVVLRAYPIPATQVIYLVSNRAGEASVELVAPDGRNASRETHRFGGAPVPVDVSGLNAGVFIVRVRFEDGETLLQRVVKMN